MIQGDFGRIIGPETVRLSGSQFRFGVEALHDSAGKLSFGPKPVQPQGRVPPQHLGHFLHGIDLRAHYLGAPCIQKLPGPVGRCARPEELKLFLQKVTSDRSEIVLQNIRQFGLLFVRQVFRSLEQWPACFREHQLKAFLVQLLRLLGVHFVNRLAQVCHDMEPVQDVDNLPRLLGNDPQVQVWTSLPAPQ